jgi:hypothetical protein
MVVAERGADCVRLPMVVAMRDADCRWLLPCVMRTADGCCRRVRCVPCALVVVKRECTLCALRINS